jgi:hypothetical protein
MARTADTAGDGERSANRRATHRACRWPRSRSASRSGKIGTATDALPSDAGTNEWLPTWRAASRGLGDAGQHGVHHVGQFGVRQICRCRTGSPQVPPGGEMVALTSQNGPKATLHPIAGNGVTEGASHGVGHMGVTGVVIDDGDTPQISNGKSPPVGPQSLELGAPCKPPDQADSRARPRARRAFKMARPARVLMRWRKPCFLARRRLLG